MSLAVYTCITGEYDWLLEPTVIDADCMYICFSNEPVSALVQNARSSSETVATAWKIVPIPEAAMEAVSEIERVRGEEMSVKERNVRIARYMKILGWKHLPSEVTRSLWIDGSFQLIKPVSVVEELLFENDDVDFVCHRHEEISATRGDAEWCARVWKSRADMIKARQIAQKEAGFNDDIGHTATGLLFRRHTEAVLRMSQIWWEEFAVNHFRDQLSVMFALWKSSSPQSTDTTTTTTTTNETVPPVLKWKFTKPMKNFSSFYAQRKAKYRNYVNPEEHEIARSMQ